MPPKFYRPSWSTRQDDAFTRQLIEALQAIAPSDETKLRLIADELAARAQHGDLAATKEIINRLEAAARRVQGAAQDPVEVTFRWKTKEESENS
jgi:hypothetical protein